MPKSKRKAATPVVEYRHPSKRKNNPPAGLVAQGKIAEAPKIRYEYNPHLPPVLRSGPAETDKLPELLAEARKRPISDNEARLLAAALRKHEPWLEWSNKREKPWFEVEPVALHIHERISTQAILRVLAREDVQRELFADPQQSYAQAVQFYQHDVEWSNRMILGDSLQVMASLARREDLAGKVQMLYFDPPYGISFKSNFQPELGQRDVRDREQDLTREPEMVKAYRDTWALGIHSYLAYLRDRLEMAKELLTDTGSIFVQISEENLHRVRCVMDEVFRPENFIGQIAFLKTAGKGSGFIDPVYDVLLWYGKEREQTKYRRLYLEKEVGGDKTSKYVYYEDDSGSQLTLTSDERENPDSIPASRRIFAIDNLTSQTASDSTTFPYQWCQETYTPGKGGWKTNEEGMLRLHRADRLTNQGRALMYKRFLYDFPAYPLNNVWPDTGSGASKSDPKLYVVQTRPLIIERCILMTTDPGDLVLDPTCGSGTTAYVAEQRGRRWITCDTSRVALALARQRLMTTRFGYYRLRELSAEDLARNPKGTWLTDPTGKLPGKVTFDCRKVSHITLKTMN